MKNHPTKKFITFSKERMKTQGDEIRRWVKQDDNPLLKQICLEVIEASEMKL